MRHGKIFETSEDNEAACKKYAELYEFAPVGYCTIDKDGVIREINATAAEQLGTDKARLLNTPLPLYIYEEDREIFSLHIRRAFETHTRQTCDIRFLRNDDALFYAQSDIVVFQENQDKAGITFSDMANRNQAVKVLQARIRLMEFAVSHSLSEVLQATLDEMEALTGSTIGFYHFLEADQKTLSLQAWSSDTIRNICNVEGRGHRYDISQAGVWVDCIRERRTVIHNDYLSLAHRKGLPPGHAPVFRELVTPVFRGGCIKAIIGVGNKAGNYNEQDIGMVSLLADLAWDIAERKRAEEVLRQSEERFRLMFYRHNAIMLLIEPETGQIIDANLSAENFYGYKIDELCRMSITDINTLPPEEIAAERMRALTEKRNHFVFPHRVASGEIRTVEVHSSPMMANNTQLLFSIIYDITERKQAEMNLRESEERFRTLTHLAPVGVYLTDPDGRCQYVNERWLNIAGMRLEQALGDGWINGVHPDDRRLILSKWRQMVESYGQWGLEYRFQTPAGKITWVLGLATELHNSLNEKIGYIGVNTDITERKHIEETLRQSEERYRTLIETMSEGFVVLNKEMAVVYVNEQFCRMSGYEKEELFGKTIDYYFDKEHQKIIGEQFVKRKHGESGVYEVELTRKNGSKGFVAISSKPIFDSENSFQGSLAVISDITLRKETDTMFITEHQTMKTQVETTMTQIDNLNREIQEYNHALKILLKNAQEDQKIIEEKIVSNVREMIAPFLEKLKNTRLSETQKSLLDVAENNLNNIISPFISRLKSEMRDFTPMEIQVANLIREGKSNKDIGDILAISEYTAMFHRKNIRKKLGLQHEKINLRTYLLSLK